MAGLWELDDSVDVIMKHKPREWYRYEEGYVTIIDLMLPYTQTCLHPRHDYHREQLVVFVRDDGKILHRCGAEIFSFLPSAIAQWQNVPFFQRE